MSETEFDILTCTVRPVTEDDWAFIHSSWCGSARSRNVKRVDKLIHNLRNREATFVVACDPEVKDHILGWACAEFPILHFVYVKELYREQGIARQLIAALDFGGQRNIWCSDWTRITEAIHEKHPTVLKRILPWPG